MHLPSSLLILLYIKQPHAKLSSNKRLNNIMAVELEDLLEFTVENNASDLHLSSGLPPMIRIDGEMRQPDSENDLRHHE
jgi:hypothetical protein